MGALTVSGAFLLGLPMCASEAPHKQATANVPPSAEMLAARAAIQAMPLAHVASRAADGTARFLVGGTDKALAPLPVSADTAARLHLARNARTLGLTTLAVDHADVKATLPIPGGGSVVQFEQQVDGVPVYGSRASIVLDASKNLVSLASTLHPAATSDLLAKKMAFRISAESALTMAYATHTGSAAGLEVVDMGAGNGDWRKLKVTAPSNGVRMYDAAAKRVLFPEGKRLVAAYQIEAVTRKPESTENEAYQFVVAADDGRVLKTKSLTAHEAFNYRVWADKVQHNIPTDGPLVDYSPHPTGTPDGVRPGYAAPILVSMEGFNTNPSGAADPWLKADATTTVEGNNVQAYTDRDDTGQPNEAGTAIQGDGLDAADVVANVTAAKTFDRVYDVTKDPNASADQEKAAVTQIFYTTNWLHDYWYDSGFDEKAGNAQKSNLGRGGVEGDPLQAQGQDGADFGQKGNANMSAMSDGMSPRMQMYVWDGLPNRKLTTTPAITFEDDIGVPSKGPATYSTAAAPIAIVDDGTAPTSDGCEAPTNVSGKVALIDFDSANSKCGSGTRVNNAKTAGAVAVLFVNTAPGHDNGGYAGSATAGIPVFGLTYEDGQKIKDALGKGAVTAALFRGVETILDGTIDNTVVAHEWGHYLHQRLEDCGGKQCSAMSEGWADFNALMMVIKEGDPVSGKAWPLAQYATAGDSKYSPYFGIRRSPYSTDVKINALTFGDIADKATLPTTAPIKPGSYNSEVHNAGEIWAETMFEAYAAFLDAGKTANPPRTFDESKRQMANYVVRSMQATPPSPTYTEQRDAILSTIWASGHKDDFTIFAKAFQKRGMGVGAVSPVDNTDDTQTTEGATFDDVVENFDYKGALALSAITLDDAGGVACDNDGVLDSGETGTITLTVKNSGWLPLSKTSAKVSTDLAGITFGNGGTIDVPALEPFAVTTVKIPVSASHATPQKSGLNLKVTLADADAYKASVDVPFATLVNFDDKLASSTSDDVESPSDDLASKTPVWSRTHGAVSHDAWTRTGDPTNHLFHGDDTPSPGDEGLVSPALTIAATGDFTIAFSHAYSFETDPGQASDAGPAEPTYYDGAVLEVTTDDGKTWEDISTYADPGYPGAVTDSPQSSNPLRGKKGYVGQSAGYPKLTDVKLNLGNKLAGKTVKIRFRIGTDDAAGVEGWDIDNIAIGGITNTPFASVVANAKNCSSPDADAGTNGGTPTGSGGGGDDGGCACSTAPGAAAGAAGVGAFGLLGGLAMLFARRRRTSR